MQLHVDWVSPTEVALIDVAHPEYRHRFRDFTITGRGIEAEHSVEKSVKENPASLIVDEEAFTEQHAREVAEAFVELLKKMQG